MARALLAFKDSRYKKFYDRKIILGKILFVPICQVIFVLKNKRLAEIK